MRPPAPAPPAAAPTGHAPKPRLRGLPEEPPARRPVRSRADTASEQLLRRTAAHLLQDVDGLARELVAQISSREPAYPATIGPEELRLEVRTSLESSVRTLLDPPGTWEAARLCSWRIGARRAQRELPLDALLHAFRLGGALVWRRLVETATRREPDDAHLLLHSAAGIWSFVDEHSDLITQAYRLVESQTAREHRERARAMVQALLDGTTRITDLPTVAAALDLPERGRYAVASLAGPAGPPRHPAEADPALAEPPPGVRIVRHRGADGEHALVLLGDAEPAQVAACLGHHRGGRVGIGTVVEELAEIGAARRSADIALRTCTADGDVALLHERLPTALVVSLPDFGTALVDRALGAVLELDHQDRESMLSTLDVWLDSAGSAQRAGTRLFCHRNTVLNRLRRYEQLSGRSLNHPRHLVELSLALDAYRLLPS
ncbi:PucR family transcriptional regulator [Streptomyces sp. NRRL B-24484]|uniref:PucR family transcriptional regulator n=1 Tax=Streptomyces sp. NRRL B-24484 TaxID=1463833 RepID=UPI000693A8D4|nr:helix-turn-helix domain-containing protein [Streptomyces sp. NRRL B-24484]